MAEGQRIISNPDILTWNRHHARARRGEPFAKTWDDFVGVRWELLDLLHGFDHARLAEPANTSVSFLSRYYYWFSICAEHDCEHAAAVENAVGADPV
jgi:hypothetical protein